MNYWACFFSSWKSSGWEVRKVVNHALALNISAFSEAGAHLSLAVHSCFIHVTLHIVSSSHMVLGLT